MNRTQRAERLKELIADKLGCATDEISNSTSLTDELGADSLDLIDMLMTIEREFNIAITDPEADNIKTFNDIVEIVETKLR